MNEPGRMAAAPVTREDRKTARPSKESAIARENASTGEMLLVESAFAFWGSAYTFRTKLKFKSEKRISLESLLRFRMKTFIIYVPEETVAFMDGSAKGRI